MFILSLKLAKNGIVIKSNNSLLVCHFENKVLIIKVEFRAKFRTILFIKYMVTIKLHLFKIGVVGNFAKCIYSTFSTFQCVRGAGKLSAGLFVTIPFKRDFLTYNHLLDP